MDMAPPQAPPAITQNENQQAVTAFDAIISTQRWLRGEMQRMPTAMDGVEASHRATLLQRLEAFWSAPAHDAPTTRKEAWASALAGVMREVATLREADGTLGTEAAMLARQVTASQGHAMPPGVRVSLLTIGGQPYAGTLVATAEGGSAGAIVFTADRGWESFSTVDDIRAVLGQRIRRAHAAGIDVPGISRAVLLGALDGELIGTREVAGDAFEALVTHAIDHQRQLVAQAWVDHAAASDNSNRDQALVDALDGALRGDALVDVESILAVRDALLIESVQQARLAKVPAAVRKDWEQAWGDHQALTNSMQGVPGEDDGVTPAEFSAARLRAALRRVGVETSPEDIVVTLERTNDPAARLESLQAFFEGPSPLTMRFVDLAWQNMASFSPVHLVASDADGNRIPMLSDAALRGIVRQANLFSTYERYLADLLRDGDEAPARKSRAAGLQRSWMRVQANEARLSYYLPHEPRSLRPDHSERGYRWIEAVLDAPSPGSRRKVEGHEVVVRSVTYRGATLKDIVEVGTRSTESIPTIILYTPDAPDGVTWREFDDRGEAARQFFYHPKFREYLLDRLPARFARSAGPGYARSFDIDRRSWVFGGPEGAGYTQTGEPFIEGEITGDFLEANYEATVNLALGDIEGYGRSATDADWAMLFTYANLRQTAIANTVVAAVQAPFRAPGAAWRFYDSVKAGDGAQAFVDFTELYNSSLALMPFFTMGRVPGGAYRHATSTGALTGRTTFRTGPATLSVSRRAVPVEALETRYLARHVRKRGEADRRGLYTIEGKQFIEHDGALYAARWDDAFDTVRLRHPDAGATAYGPAIRRIADARWIPHHVGLQGGSGRSILRRLLGHETTSAPPAPGFNAWEQAAFQRNLDFELYSRIPHTPSRLDLLRRVEEDALMGRASTLPAEQALMWGEASQAAYQTVTRLRHRVPAASRPVDMSFPPAPVAQPATARIPRGYRVVAPADVPPVLYLVDRLPYKRSAFKRDLRLTQRQGHGFSNQYASLMPESLAPGVRGVRVTTLPPSSSRAQLHEALGIVPTKKTFMVRLDSHMTMQRMARNQRELQVLEVEGTSGTVFVLRPVDGQPVSVVEGEFLPPVMWGTP